MVLLSAALCLERESMEREKERKRVDRERMLEDPELVGEIAAEVSSQFLVL